MWDVDGDIPDVVGLETDTSLRILTESGVEAEVVRMKDWSRHSEKPFCGASRVVCQRVSGQKRVVLLVAPDLYKQVRD